MHSERKVITIATLNSGGADKIAADHSNPSGKLPTPEVKVTEHRYPHPFFAYQMECSFNPLSPSIHIQILQTDLHTFP